MQNHQKAILISWSMTVWHNDLVTCYDIVLLNLLSNGHELHESAYYCSSDQHKGIICLNVVTWISYLGLEREALKVFNRTWQCDVSSIKNQFKEKFWAFECCFVFIGLRYSIKIGWFCWIANRMKFKKRSSVDIALAILHEEKWQSLPCYYATLSEFTGKFIGRYSTVYYNT